MKGEFQEENVEALLLNLPKHNSDHDSLRLTVDRGYGNIQFVAANAIFF